MQIYEEVKAREKLNALRQHVEWLDKGLFSDEIGFGGEPYDTQTRCVFYRIEKLTRQLYKLKFGKEEEEEE